MTLIRVEQWDARRDGPLSEEALQNKIEALGGVVKARTYPAAVATPAPLAEADVIVGVVRGLIKITAEGEQKLLAAGDIALIPGGAPAAVELAGPSTALCLEAVAPHPRDGSHWSR